MIWLGCLLFVAGIIPCGFVLGKKSYADVADQLKWISFVLFGIILSTAGLAVAVWAMN